MTNKSITLPANTIVSCIQQIDESNYLIHESLTDDSSHPIPKLKHRRILSERSNSSLSKVQKKMTQQLIVDQNNFLVDLIDVEIDDVHDREREQVEESLHIPIVDPDPIPSCSPIKFNNPTVDEEASFFADLHFDLTYLTSKQLKQVKRLLKAKEKSLRTSLQCQVKP